MKLSIIIPVYITEDEILSRFNLLISELVLQRAFYQDTEIICVDDGSPLRPSFPDGVKVIHQENMGIAGARNTGLNRAQGEWVTFIDDDDWIVPEYLETIHRFLRDRFQYISFDWRFEDGQPSVQYTPGYRNNAVWAYVIRRSVIADNRFNTEIRNGSEDIDFVKRVINKDRLHKDISAVLYIYFWHKNKNSYLHRVLRGEIE